MAESSEARRKRLKALSQSAADDNGGEGLASGAAALANPFADEGGPPANSGPFNFYRWVCRLQRQQLTLILAPCPVGTILADFTSSCRR